MKITKLEHACVVLQKNGSTLIIDPGSFTLPLTDRDGVDGIVITHEHADHWTPDHLRRLRERNPQARIIGPAGVAAAVEGFEVESVADGDRLEVGDFTLKFFGGSHAMIHESIPIVDNVAVLVDDTFYYAGDSFTVPPVAVDVLAVPIGAPWLKIGEAMDFVLEVAPKRSFGVHEAVLSQIGKTMATDRIRSVTERGGGEFVPLEPGETLDI